MKCFFRVSNDRKKVAVLFALQLSLLTRMNCSFGKQMHVLVGHAALGYDFQHPISGDQRGKLEHLEADISFQNRTLMR